MFRFKRAHCVAVGTFNIYIIQPAWLSEVGIIPKGSPVEVYSKLDEPGFRFSSPKLATRWVITPNRIQVETDKPDENCGEAMAKVLGQLPWTPLVALGNNTIYQAPLEDLSQIPALTALDPKIPEGFDVAQKTIHIAMKRGDTLYNLQLAAAEDEIELSSNVHTDLREHKSDFAQEAARRFLEDRRTAQTLISALFEVSVSDVSEDNQSSQGTDGGNGQP